MAEKKKNNTTKTKQAKKMTSKKTKDVVSKKKESVKKTKKVEKKKTSLKDFFSSIPFLAGVFSCLVILITVLGVLIYQKEKKAEEEFDAHMTVPVFEVGSSFEFGVDASLLVKERKSEYVFKVVNYRDDQINEEEVPYHLVVLNNTNAVVSLTKDGSSDNLITSQKSSEIEGETLISGEKEEVYYRLKITSHKKLKTNDFIYVHVVS